MSTPTEDKKVMAHRRLTALVDACSRAGLNIVESADINRAIWEKFVFLVGLSATTATMRSISVILLRDVCDCAGDANTRHAVDPIATKKFLKLATTDTPPRF